MFQLEYALIYYVWPYNYIYTYVCVYLCIYNYGCVCECILFMYLCIWYVFINHIYRLMHYWFSLFQLQYSFVKNCFFYLLMYNQGVASKSQDFLKPETNVSACIPCGNQTWQAGKKHVSRRFQWEHHLWIADVQLLCLITGGTWKPSMSIALNEGLSLTWISLGTQSTAKCNIGPESGQITWGPMCSVMFLSKCC